MSEQTQTKQLPAPKLPSKFGVMLSLLLSGFALAVSFYTLFIQSEQQQVLDQGLDNSSQFTQKLEQLMQHNQQQADQALGRWQDKLSHLMAAQDNQQAEVKTLKQGLLKALQQKNQRPDDWMLFEVNHLLRLSVLKLKFSHDLPTAIHLLNLAEQRVIAMGDPSLSNLQKAIHDMIAQCQQLPTVDVDAINAQLTQLSQMTTTLQFMQPADLVLAQSQQQSDSEDVSGWKAAWQRTLQKLSKVIVVKKHQDLAKPILQPQQQLLIQENIQLILQQVQIALLQSNQALFQKSVMQAKRVIMQYAKDDDAVTLEMLSALDQVAKTNLQASYPDLNYLIEMVDQEIKQRQLSQQAKLLLKHLPRNGRVGELA